MHAELEFYRVSWVLILECAPSLNTLPSWLVAGLDGH